YSQVFEQVGVEHPPEAMIGVAFVLDDGVKLVLGATLNGPPLVIGGKDAAPMKRLENVLAIEEQERVADVEKDRGKGQSVRRSSFFNRRNAHCSLRRDGRAFTSKANEDKSLAAVITLLLKGAELVCQWSLFVLHHVNR